jgi:hypothetical protein
MINDANKILETKKAELARLVSEFIEKVDLGTADGDKFMSFHEMECLWSELRLNSDKLYSDMLCDILGGIDEEELIRKKKPSTREKESN